MSEINRYEGRRTGAELSKRDGLPEQAFSGEGRHSGPVLLDIAGDSVNGSVRVEGVRFPSVRVYTRSTMQAVIDAVRETRIHLSDNTLTVRVPEFQVPPTVIQGNGSRMVFIDRVTEGIEATASSGSLNVGEYTGSHAKLRVSSGSMNLNVGRAASGLIDVRVSSGSANIGGTRGRTDLDIRTKKSSGSINLY